MADIDKVKRNIGRLLEQGAPEADVDAYLASEGVKLEELRSPVKQEDIYQKTAREEYQQQKAAGVPVGAGLARRAVQGATFNTADEMLAGAMTPLEMIKRGTFNPAEGYRYAKAREDYELDEARKEGGLLGPAAEVAGGVLSGSTLAKAGLSAASYLPKGANLLKRSAASAADGLGFGLLSGAMEGNSLEERGKNAGMGGMIGLGVGGAAPAVIGMAGAAASPFVSNIRARINPTGYAQSQVARGVMESGQTPAQIAGKVGQASAEGQPMFAVADAMGNAGQRMLSTTARAPGAARTAVVDFLDGRQAGQGRRIAGSLAEGFDSPQTSAQTRVAMTEARDTAADTAYTAARQNAGAVDLSNVISRIDDTLQPGINQIASPKSGLANDSIEAALDGFRSRLTNGREVLSDFTATQRVRGDLSDMVEAAKRAGQGNRARLLGGVLREMDNAMEQASTGFKAANRNFSQSSKDIAAVDEGRTAALRGRVEDTVPRFQSLTPEGKQGFRSGYVDPLIENAQGAAFGANKARPLINDAFQTEAATMAPGNPLMQRRIGREDTMFQTRNQALGNSKTAENLADDAAMGIDVGMVGQVLSGNWGGALKSALAAGSNHLTGNTPAVREEVAKILMQRGQNVSPASIQSLLDETVRRIELVSSIAQQLGRGGSAGLAVAPSSRGNRH